MHREARGAGRNITKSNFGTREINLKFREIVHYTRKISSSASFQSVYFSAEDGVIVCLRSVEFPRTIFGCKRDEGLFTYHAILAKQEERGYPKNPPAWFKCVTWLNILELKLVENVTRIFLSFQNCACCEKHLKNNKQNRIHLAQKYAPWCPYTL